MKNKYLISIITPSHNVDLILFQRAFKSLKAQTVGFEKIEWIIVSHNSTEQNTKGLESIVGTYSNVSVHVLKNDINNPSSPRNFALEKATGPYIGFLDADDTFEPNTFEVALKHIQETESEVAVFCFDTKNANNNHQLVHPYELIDQTKEVIVAQRQNWDSKDFIYGPCLSVCTKIYNHSFLNKNNLKFDEEVPIGEDVLFNLDCFDKVNKICFLPQLTGYNYFMNDVSIVHSLDKTYDEMMEYTKGIIKIFDHGLSYCFYMNNLMWDLMGYGAATLLASVNLTLKQRKSVSDLLLPYLKKVTKIEISKVYDPKKARLIMLLTNTVIKHPRLIYHFTKLMKALGVDIGSKIKV